MRILITIIFGIINLTLSAKTERRIVEFNGSIAEKYKIKMVLTIEDSVVLGYYYYENYKSKILLDGKIDGTNIILNESPNIEPDFKVGFKGRFDNKRIIGEWIDSDKEKKLSFNALVVSDGILKVSERINQIEGHYDNVNSSDKYMSSIGLKFITDNVFCFEISNGTESGCVGYIKKLVDLENLSFGKYSGDSCEEIMITIISDTINVKEKNCEWHGMRCPFDGNYKKK